MFVSFFINLVVVLEMYGIAGIDLLRVWRMRVCEIRMSKEAREGAKV